MNFVRRTVLRAGLSPAPDNKPATAAEGRTFSPFSNSVGADYFAAVGLPLLRGRAFTSAEPHMADMLLRIDEVPRKLWQDVTRSTTNSFPSEGASPKRDDNRGQISGERSKLWHWAGDQKPVFEKEPAGSLYCLSPRLSKQRLLL